MCSLHDPFCWHGGENCLFLLDLSFSIYKAPAVLQYVLVEKLLCALEETNPQICTNVEVGMEALSLKPMFHPRVLCNTGILYVPIIHSRTTS